MTSGITLTESMHPFAFVVSEDESYMSREQVAIAPSQTIVVGQVLGRLVIATSASAASTANVGNTGNGALTLATPAADTSVRQGAYKVTFLDATHFLVEGPTGIELGEGVVGSAWAKGLKFTIAAGGTAFVAGDGFTVQATVDKSIEQYVAHNPAATDGSQTATAIALYPVVTSNSAPANLAVIARLAQVRRTDLTFAPGITSAQVDQVVADLAARDIIMR